METLMTLGGFVPLPYVFYTVIQSARRRGQVDFFGTLLAYAAVLIPVGLVTWAALMGGTQPFLTIAAVVSSGIMILFSVIIIVRDARTPNRSLNRSYGVLGLVVALLIIAGVLVIPVVLPLIPGMSVNTAAAETTDTANSFPPFAAPADGTTFQPPDGFTPGQFPGAATDTTAADQTASDTAAETVAETTSTSTSLRLPNAPAGFALPQSDTSANVAEAEPEVIAEPTAIAPTPEVARLTYDDFTANVLANMEPINVSVGTVATESPGADVDAAASETGANLPSVGNTSVESGLTCVLTLQYNLNLRESASADSELILTIPYTEPLTGTELVDGWWRVTYNGINGWVSGEYVTTSPDCAGLVG